MGLQKDIVLDNGLEVENAYLKIVSIGGDKSTFTYNIGAFIDKNNTSGQPLKIFYNSLSANIEDNLWQQIYEQFKTTEDGMNAIDV